jgi:hypothetical protein
MPFSELWSCSVIQAEILLEWKQEAESSAARQLSRFLKSSKGKGVQGVVDIGRAFLS